MKAIVLKENLKSGLSIVEKIVGKNLTLPILNNILVKTEKNFINLITTNLEIGIKYWVLAKVNEEGSLVVPNKVFSNFISGINEEKVSLDVKNNTLDIKSNDFKTQIKGFDSQEFPLIPEIDNQEYIDISAQHFCDALNHVVNYCSLNQSRPEIAGIYLNFQKDKLVIVSTDSFRLAEKTITLSESLSKDHRFIIPQKTAQEVINIFSTEEKIRIYFSANQILFETDFKEVKHPKVQLTSILIQGDFPNYKDIIPQKYETRVSINKDEFLGKIKVASLFSNKTNEIKIDIDSSRGGVDIFSQNTDIGENESFLSAQIEGKDSSICFNYKFLIDGLSGIKSKNINFDVNGDSGPSVITPVGDNTYLYLVMPIKNT